MGPAGRGQGREEAADVSGLHLVEPPQASADNKDVVDTAEVRWKGGERGFHGFNNCAPLKCALELPATATSLRAIYQHA